jgi:signal transduction histidine kinase
MTERNRLARELHDSLGHYLTVVHVQLQAAASQLDLDRGKAAASLETAMRLTREGLDDVRRSVAALRASPLEQQPLADAIRSLVDELSTTGTSATLTVNGAARPLSPPAELAVFRAAQEALTNVRKHARAATADVSLEYGDRFVRLRVADDGQGARETEGRGFGLVGVRERARLVGGLLEIDGTKSFTLVLTVPG